MSRAEIIRMAKNKYGIYAFTVESLVELVALVAADEREACAKVCEELKWRDPPLNFAENCAKAIRAMGQA